MRDRFVLTVGIVVLLAGCSLEQRPESSVDSRKGASGGSVQAPVAGPHWREYMPVREGQVCTYSSTGEVMGITAKTVLTQKYTDVREEPDGTHFMLESATETATSTEEQYGEAEGLPSLSETESLEYVLGADGLLRSEPQLFNRGNLEANVDGFIVYPSIKEVREGKSASSSMTASVRSSDPATQAELEESLETGESEMKVRLDYKVTGVPPEEVSTPSGTFTDVVGVSIEIEDIEMLNANEAARREMDGIAELLTDLSGTPIVWFARDVGVVQTETEGAAMGDKALAIKLDGCNGELTGAPSGSPTDHHGEEGESEVSEPASPEPADDPYGDDKTGGDSSSSEESQPEHSPVEVLDLQYEHINAGDYEEAYELFAEQSKQIVSLEQYRAYFEANAPYSVTSYSVASVEEQGDEANVEATLTVNSAGSDQSYPITQGFVWEDGGWRVVMRADQVTAFAEAWQEAPQNEQHDAPDDDKGVLASSELFVGEWFVHGSQMTIRPDFTGTRSTSLGPCTDPFGPDASDDMCNEIAGLDFSEGPTGSIVATVTSVDYETWEGETPPTGFEGDGTFRVGDSFELEFADENLLRTIWLGRLSRLNGQGNPYWCNSQTSTENVDKCGA